MFLMPGCNTNTFHVIYAGDLARAYYLAVTGNLQGIHRIILGNPSADKMAKIYGLFCEEAGLKKPRFLPKFITYPIGLVIELMYQAFGIKTIPTLTRGRVNMLYDSNAFNTSKAAVLLGFNDTIPLEEGIRRTVNWYKENKYI